MTWEQIANADFDGDGDNDILWRHPEGAVTIWEMESGQYVVNHNQPEAPSEWAVAAARDFNGDGDADLLWRHQEGALTIWEMADNRYQINHNLPAVSSEWALTNTAKYDGDKDYDIQWTHTTGQVVYWEIEDHQFVRHAPDLTPADIFEQPIPEEATRQVSLSGSSWQHLFGSNGTQPSGNPWSIVFNENRDIDYVLTSAGGLGLDDARGVRMTFEVDGGGFRATEGSSPATVGFMVSSGGPLGARFWSHEGGRVQLQDGIFVLEVPLDPSVWTGVFGGHDARGFEATLAGATNFGITFGGDFFGHGVVGSGTFTLLDMDILI